MVFNVREFTKPSSRRTISRGRSQKSKFEKQREVEVVRNAHERGYLKSPTLESIWESIGEKCHVEEIRYLNMNRIHLHKVKSIDLCTRLKVCVLHSNYISNFEALGNCPELLCLDLHGNQIVSVPGQRFWAGLSQLQVLYLHDNGLSRLDHAQYMAASPSLSILTLYNTPLCLKPNYRHHVVNSLWSLKALDNYIISDEEIIEDATFGGRYSSMGKSFNLPLYVSLSKESTYEEAVKRVYHLTGMVNYIQAKHCPVLIIQKWIRGFLARLRYTFIQDMRIWAAVSIQRFYRHYKGLEPSNTRPPPSSPTPNRSWHGLDYDAYMRGLKPGHRISPSSSSERIRRRPSSRSVSIVVEPVTRIIEEEEPPDTDDRITTSPVDDEYMNSISTPFPLRISTRVTINLQSLETSTNDIIRAKDAVSVERRLGLKSRRLSTREAVKSRGVSTRETVKSRDLSTCETFRSRSKGKETKTKELIREEQKLKERGRKGKKKGDKVGRYSTVKEFLGPIMDTHPVTENELMNRDEGGDVPTVNFRLAGFQPPIQKMDPLQEVLISKREAGIDVREAAREQERKILNEPRRVATRFSTTTTDQRLFIRTHGTMGLACLRAVQQAYRDRERAESLSARTGLVARRRERREQAKERVKIFKQEYQEESIRRRIRDGVRTAEALKEQDDKRVLIHEQYANVRAVTAERQKSRQADFAFANDFACQQSSVSNALLKHDFLTQKEETLQELVDAVRKEKDVSQAQQVLVRRYLEHRQLMRQAETAMARANLDATMLQEANQRVIEAKTRVARQKARNEQVREVSPLTISKAPPQLPPLGVVAQDQMELWEKLPKFDWRPRSHERSVSEPATRHSVLRSQCYSVHRSYGVAEKAI